MIFVYSQKYGLGVSTRSRKFLTTNHQHLSDVRKRENKMENFFKLKQLGTNVRTEVLAGFTTFLTMSYIVVVNPAILSAAGVPFEQVFIATVVSAIRSEEHTSELQSRGLVVFCLLLVH